MAGLGSGPQAAWQRRGLLLVLAGLHVLAFLCWRTPMHMADNGEQAKLSSITYILPDAPAALRAKPLPPEKFKLATAPTHEPKPQAITPTDLKPAQLAPQAITQPAIPAAEPGQQAGGAADPFAMPPARPSLSGSDGIRQLALKSAGNIDRQLRKESWNPRDKFVANDTTALAAKMSDGYVGGGGGTTFEQITLADGSLMTKVHLPNGGTYCATQESNGLTGGRDPFREGAKVKVTNCPR